MTTQVRFETAKAFGYMGGHTPWLIAAALRQHFGMHASCTDRGGYTYVSLPGVGPYEAAKAAALYCDPLGVGWEVGEGEMWRAADGASPATTSPAASAGAVAAGATT